MAIRNAAKAIILHNDKILLNKIFNENKLYYDLPGGGQNKYETLEEAVIRECLEETGFDVLPEKIIAIYEEIVLEKEFRHKYPEHAHKIYFLFLCTLKNEISHNSTEKDFGQIACEWIPLDEVLNLNLLPTGIKKHILSLIDGNSIKFLGSDKVYFNDYFK